MRLFGACVVMRVQRGQQRLKRLVERTAGRISVFWRREQDTYDVINPNNWSGERRENITSIVVCLTSVTDTASVLASI